MSLRNRRGQAILELAILGSIVILAFSYAIKYSERYNREQSYMQQTFRAALKKAKSINNSASWSAIDFRRMSNVTNPMELGELQQFSSSSNVLWSDGKSDESGDATEAESWFELNRNKQTQLASGGVLYNTTVTSNSSFKSDAAGTTTFTKKETGGNITTSKQLTASDSITGSADMGGSSVDLGGSLGSGGRYVGGGVTRYRSMQ
jgi:uncharacterized protein (UPF0333 family)